MDLRVKMTQEQFARLSGFDLGRELIQPAIQQARGQSLEIKKRVYEDLTPGQKSLFAFWVLYGHTGSGWQQFFQEGAGMGGYAQYLPMIKTGIQYIHDQALLKNILWAEKLYDCYREKLDTAPEGTGSNDITQVFAPASETLLCLLPETMRRLEAYIRFSPEEFLG